VAAKCVTKGECSLNVSPPCDRLLGDEIFHREGEDKFPSLDVSGVAAGKGGTCGECCLFVSPNCDGLPGDDLSHREGKVNFLRLWSHPDSKWGVLWSMRPSYGPALCQTSHGEGEDKFSI
jgi:hypothetical protein